MGEIRQQVDKALTDATTSGAGARPPGRPRAAIQGLIVATQILADHLDTIQDGLRKP